MNQLLLDLVSAIVDNPQAVSVEETLDDQGMTTLKLKVDPQDIGRVIGKEGKIITALRTLLRLAAMKQGKRVRIDLIEPDQPPLPPQEAPQQT